MFTLKPQNGLRMSTSICVECAAPVGYLYTVLADNNIHATKCDNCGQFADKYIESESVLVAIDVLLLRPSAIRHIVFNESHQEIAYAMNDLKSLQSSDAHKPSQPLFWGISSHIFRLILLTILSDVYFEWVDCEKLTDPIHKAYLTHIPFLCQYIIFLILCVTETFLVHFAVRKTTALITKNHSSGGNISTALLIGSYFKFLPLLTHIWNYDAEFMARIVDYSKFYCMTDIMASTLNCSFWLACLPTIVNFTCSWILHKVFWWIIHAYLYSSM